MDLKRESILDRLEAKQVQPEVALTCYNRSEGVFQKPRTVSMTSKNETSTTLPPETKMKCRSEYQKKTQVQPEVALTKDCSSFERENMLV